MRHPMQPIILDKDGTPRFHANAIVSFLMDAGPFTLNHLASMPWEADDRAQFAMLLGYSVSGFGELSYVEAAVVAEADAKAVALAQQVPPASSEPSTEGDACIARLNLVHEQLVAVQERLEVVERDRLDLWQQIGTLQQRLPR